MTNSQIQIYTARIRNRKFYSSAMEKRNAAVYYAVLVICCMLFGLNTYLDYVLTAAFFMSFLIAFRHNFFIFTYIALIFFESKLVIPNFSASILRILTLFYLFRLIFSRNLTIKMRKCRYTVIFIIIYFLLNVSDISGITSFLSIFTNLINIFVIACEYYSYNRAEKKNVTQLFLLIIAVFAMMSGIYGFYNGEVFSYGGFRRYCGTIDDPNYSALLYCLGYVSLYGVKNIKSIWKVVLFVGLSIDILLTVSMSGIATFLLITFIWLLIKKPSKALFLLLLGIICFVLFLKVPFEEGNIFYGIQTRIINIFTQISNGDFSSVTSGRTEIAAAYMQEFNNLPLTNKLFGGLNTVFGDYRDYMANKVGNVSHNSYIDILFRHGIVGLVLLIGGILLRIVKILGDYYKRKSDDLAFAMQKITLLIFSFTLSIYPYRYFIFFMLI